MGDLLQSVSLVMLSVVVCLSMRSVILLSRQVDAQRKAICKLAMMVHATASGDGWKVVEEFEGTGEK